MKKKWMGVLLALLALLNGIPVGAVRPPEACPVPEAVLHEAVLSIGRTQIGEDSEGEFLCEGHIVLGSEETEDAVDVYAVIRYIDYGFMAGIFTDSGGGCGMIPVKMTFAEPGYTFVSVQWPEDGENHYRSIAQMLPDELEDAWADEGVRPALDAQIIAQAEAYVKSLGRTEKVMDWRLLDPPLDIARMLVAASNTLGRLYPYPLWVTEREDVEDGVRYRYERIWQPDGVCGGVIYTVNGKQADCMDGDTGVEILRRTRLTDGAVPVSYTHLYAAVMEGESYERVDLTGPIALVIGAEGEGVSRLVKEKCDGTVSLPIRGQIDSLNASVAAGILMYAVVRARGEGQKK